MLHYLADAIPLPDLSDGLCVGCDYPDAWHADIHRQAKARRVAKHICTMCPAVGRCRDYALKNDETLTGIWGALTEKERAKIRARQKTKETDDD